MGVFLVESGTAKELEGPERVEWTESSRWCQRVSRGPSLIGLVRLNSALRKIVVKGKVRGYTSKQYVWRSGRHRILTRETKKHPVGRGRTEDSVFKSKEWIPICRWKLRVSTAPSAHYPKATMEIKNKMSTPFALEVGGSWNSKLKKVEKQPKAREIRLVTEAEGERKHHTNPCCGK